MKQYDPADWTPAALAASAKRAKDILTPMLDEQLEARKNFRRPE